MRWDGAFYRDDGLVTAPKLGTRISWRTHREGCHWPSFVALVSQGNGQGLGSSPKGHQYSPRLVPVSDKWLDGVMAAEQQTIHNKFRPYNVHTY